MGTDYVSQKENLKFYVKSKRAWVGTEYLYKLL